MGSNKLLPSILLTALSSGAVGQTSLAIEETAVLPASAYCDDGSASLRRPGVAVDEYQLPSCDANPELTGLSPWSDTIPLGPAVPDRWRIVESIGIETNLWDPYNGHNPLKGDRPVWGKDWFYSLIAISDTVIEPRRFPVPVGVSTTVNSGSLDTIGRGEGLILAQNLILENVFYKGNTVFKPPDWEFRFTPVININQVRVRENGVLNVNPSIDSEQRTDHFLGIQALFVDKHLRNVSDRYDFDSIRVGIQPFSSDFRGFLFQDSQFGVRLFGNRKNNVYQYNLAWFRRLEKDTNSGLNDVTQRLRDDDIFVANLYRQDFPALGFTSQISFLYNRNRESGQFEFDKNGFIARPSSLFEERARDYDVTYLGYSGDGHVGRFNLTTSVYLAGGSQSSTRIQNVDEDVRAFFLAAEGSMDFDWFRPKVSLLWASGDDNPFDSTAKGFDAVFENPQFAGADTSFAIRQNIPFIGGGGVTLMGRNGILPSLRPSKEQGQSNFINPGLQLFGLGFDADISPVLRASFNWNYLRFDQTQVLERLRQQGPVSSELGHDISASLIWRPLLSQNIVLRLSAATLSPGDGFNNLYGAEAETPYSILANITLTY